MLLQLRLAFIIRCLESQEKEKRSGDDRMLLLAVDTI